MYLWVYIYIISNITDEDKKEDIVLRSKVIVEVSTIVELLSICRTELCGLQCDVKISRKGLLTHSPFISYPPWQISWIKIAS